MIFCSSRPRRTTRRIRGRAVKALRSGRSQLCWRGFESHRMQHLFCFFCRLQVTLFRTRRASLLAHVSGVGVGDAHGFTLVTQERAADTYHREGHTRKTLSVDFSRPKLTTKGYGGTGIRARVKRITTAYANHYTIPPCLGVRLASIAKLGER